ncbi:MAG: sugar phosphate isomerase/epimerase family protein [Verrucomicrobiota bacterium]
MKNAIVLNRRRFLAGAAAISALSLVQPVPLFANEEPRKFCAFEKPLQFLNYDQLADTLATAGFDGVEATVRDGGHVSPERVEQDLPRLHDALKRRGLEISIATTGINDVDSPHAEKVLRMCARLGVKRYRLLWYQYDLQKPVLPQLEVIRRRLKKPAALNRELGLTALYQNHSGDKMVGAPIWDIFSVIKDFDPMEIAFAYDTRHAAVEGGLSWPIQLNLVRSHLGAVFVKDFVWENGSVKNVPLGRGLVGQKVFAQLKGMNFAGPLSVHVEYLERSQDKAALGDAFKKDLDTLKTFLG